jgi:hypothetical protein
VRREPGPAKHGGASRRTGYICLSRKLQPCQHRLDPLFKAPAVFLFQFMLEAAQFIQIGGSAFTGDRYCGMMICGYQIA